MSIFTRLITKTGPKSRGITLPKPWIKHQNLETGDSLKITEENGSLRIETDTSDIHGE